MADLLITIHDGALRFIYHDDLAPLLGEGDAHVMRASHVEPSPDGGWTADLTPVGGPILGPYPLRQPALDAEVAWLREHLLGASVDAPGSVNPTPERTDQ